MSQFIKNSNVCIYFTVNSGNIKVCIITNVVKLCLATQASRKLEKVFASAQMLLSVM